MATPTNFTSFSTQPPPSLLLTTQLVPLTPVVYFTDSSHRPHWLLPFKASLETRPMAICCRCSSVQHGIIDFYSVIQTSFHTAENCNATTWRISVMHK